MCVGIVETKMLKTYFWLSDIAFASFRYSHIYLFVYNDVH